MANGKIIFFGTSSICLPYLEILKENFTIALIITQPDKRGGRKKKLITPPVKQFAQEYNIEYIQPVTLRDPDVKAKIESCNPELGVVISYGQFIPPSVFRIPIHNTINVHFSMLPLYRGAAPVQRAIQNGDTKTGVTIFEIEKKMDTGPVWAQEEYKIDNNDTTASLWEKLSKSSSPLLKNTINNIFNNKISKKPQDHEKATYTSQIDKCEGLINWDMSSDEIYNRVRAFNPWPGVCFILNHKKIGINEALPEGNKEYIDRYRLNKAGDILELNKEYLSVKCSMNTILKIFKIKPECKKEMTPLSFSLGNKFPENLS